MILLPWIFLLLTGNGPPTITVTEISLRCFGCDLTQPLLAIFVDRQNPAARKECQVGKSQQLRDILRRNADVILTKKNRALTICAYACRAESLIRRWGG